MTAATSSTPTSASSTVSCAAESRVARELRTVLRDERGMPRSHTSAKGYWLRSGDWLDDED